MPAAGFALHAIAVEGLSRSNPLRAARALALAAMALPRARKLLRELAPDAVMGGGGYVAGPVGVAALTLRIPLVLTEADSHLGLTNRLLAPFARRVCLAFALPGRDGGRYRVTGRPIPPPAHDRVRRTRALRDRAGRDVRAGVRRLAGGALDQPGGGRGVRGSALSRAARQRPARPRRAGGARAAGGLRPARVPRPRRLRGCARGRRPGGRARGRVGVRDRRARAAGGARPLPARVGRPSERERALDVRRGRRGGDPRRGAQRRAPGRRGGRAAGRSRAPAGDGRRRPRPRATGRRARRGSRSCWRRRR